MGTLCVGAGGWLQGAAVSDSCYSVPPAALTAEVAELRAGLSVVAAVLVDAGVPLEVLLDDVRKGAADAAARHSRSVR